MSYKLISFLLLLISLPGIGQVYVNGINLNETDLVYCRIIESGGPLFSSKVYADTDYGQVDRSRQPDRITDKGGSPILFNSTVDIFNYMESNGWNYIETTEKNHEGSSISIFLFRKNTPLIVHQREVHQYIPGISSSKWDCIPFIYQ